MSNCTDGHTQTKELVVSTAIYSDLECTHVVLQGTYAAKYHILLFSLQSRSLFLSFSYHSVIAALQRTMKLTLVCDLLCLGSEAPVVLQHAFLHCIRDHQM